MTASVIKSGVGDEQPLVSRVPSDVLLLAFG